MTEITEISTMETRTSPIEKELSRRNITNIQIEHPQDEEIPISEALVKEFDINYSQENIPAEKFIINFSDRDSHQETESFEVHHIKPEKEDPKAPIIISLPGGTITDKTIIGGKYNATLVKYLEEQNVPVELFLIKNRGTDNHFQKTDYTLNDRVTDTLILIEALKDQIAIGRKLVLLGDSMGGAVVAYMSGMLKRIGLDVDAVIAVEPADYSQQALFAPMMNYVPQEVWEKNREGLGKNLKTTPSIQRESNTQEHNEVKYTAIERNNITPTEEDKVVISNPQDAQNQFSLTDILRNSLNTNVSGIGSDGIEEYSQNPEGKVLIVIPSEDSIIGEHMEEYEKIANKQSNVTLKNPKGDHGSTTLEEFQAIRDTIKSLN